jgi:hypothetical protein
MWTLWGGHFFAAASAAVALRVAFWQAPERAVVLTYLILAALGGMAVFTLAGKMTRGFYLLAAGAWAAAVAVAAYPDWSPLLYGAWATAGNAHFGLYLRKLGKELG